jgi:hypothetical protein
MTQLLSLVLVGIILAVIGLLVSPTATIVTAIGTVLLAKYFPVIWSRMLGDEPRQLSSKEGRFL